MELTEAGLATSSPLFPSWRGRRQDGECEEKAGGGRGGGGSKVGEASPYPHLSSREGSGTLAGGGRGSRVGGTALPLHHAPRLRPALPRTPRARSSRLPISGGDGESPHERLLHVLRLQPRLSHLAAECTQSPSQPAARNLQIHWLAFPTSRLFL